MDDCLTDDAIDRFVRGAMSPEERERTDAHCAHCATCRADIAEVARSLEPEGASDTVDLHASPAQAEAALEGTEVGRYRIARRLGVGGMGVVYAAEDTVLGRSVALKLLRHHGQEHAPGPNQARLLSEARAMAQLSHPNVVAVHDVGTFEGRVFVAMELVDGLTLRQWLSTEKRPWREVLSVFLEAGQGLAAAHDKGLVHRDFKPENVLVGADGRVRVTDFGIATSFGDEGRREGPLAASTASTTDFTPWLGDNTLTQTGLMKGTLRYMSPEQFLGQSCDSRTDQFSFCVALFEGLYGQHPFDAGDVNTLARLVSTGVVKPLPRQTDVPAAVGAAVLRGLMVEPSARFTSIGALLAALREGLAATGAPIERGGSRARPRWAVPAAAALTTVAAATIALFAWPGAPGRATVEPPRRVEPSPATKPPPAETLAPGEPFAPSSGSGAPTQPARPALVAPTPKNDGAEPPTAETVEPGGAPTKPGLARSTLIAPTPKNGAAEAPATETVEPGGAPTKPGLARSALIAPTPKNRAAEAPPAETVAPVESLEARTGSRAPPKPGAVARPALVAPLPKNKAAEAPPAEAVAPVEPPVAPSTGTGAPTKPVALGLIQKKAAKPPPVRKASRPEAGSKYDDAPLEPTFVRESKKGPP